MKKGKLKIINGGRVGFYCPGCDAVHVIPVGGQDSYAWGFNGNYDKPTFTPSVLVHPSWHLPPDWEAETAPKDADGKLAVNSEGRLLDAVQTPRCHTFVTDGKIQYLSDCTHKLAGQTIDMVDILDDND